MYEALLKEQLFDKIEDNSAVAIFGACPAGERILDDIKNTKRMLKLLVLLIIL